MTALSEQIVTEKPPMTDPSDYRGRNQFPKIHELMVRLWFNDGWYAERGEPYLFRTLVREITQPGFSEEKSHYVVDSVDYEGASPETILEFSRHARQLRLELSVVLAQELDVPIDNIHKLKRGVMWFEGGEA